MSSFTSRIIRNSFQLFSALPVPWSALNAIERLSALKQGKGWGSSTISQEIDCCVSVLKIQPSIVFDIGANKGLYTEVLMNRYSETKYFLFEPSSSNYQFLRHKFREYKNINIFQVAVSNSAGSASLYSNEEGSGLASLTRRRLEHLQIDMHQEYSVQTIRLDEFLNEYLPSQVIDYIKIDIEGHELDALDGLGLRIKDVKLIQFEFGGCNIDTRTFFRDFWDFFKANNFRVYRITPTGCRLIAAYSESDEFFSTTNYIAANNTFDSSTP